MQIESWPIAKLREYKRNPRKNAHAVDDMARLIDEFGFKVPILAKSSGLIVDGHLRFKAAKQLGLAEVPVISADDLTPAQIKAFRIAVNRSTEWAEWDNGLLIGELQGLERLGFDLSLTGFDLAELMRGEANDSTPRVSLAESFGVPPFSVLNARLGWWQERKKAWLALGIQSELGRGEGPRMDATASFKNEGALRAFQRTKKGRQPTAVPGGSPAPLDRKKQGKANATPGGSKLPANYSKNRARGDGRGRPVANG
jgi:hypothetical protein